MTNSALVPFMPGSIIEKAGGLVATPQNIALALVEATMICVVDVSGSMETADAGKEMNMPRHEAAQNALTRLQERHPGQIAIGAFSSGSIGLVPNGKLPAPNGCTPLHGAMQFFYPTAIQTGKKFVIISDGEPTDDGNKAVEMARYHKYPIYAIYVGNRDDMAGGKAFMRRLADASGGKFDFIDLEDIFLLEQKIAGYLSARAS
jgi:hypothetical protein